MEDSYARHQRRARGFALPCERETWEYQNVYGDKSIHAKGEALVWVQGSAVVILYAWTGKDIDKVWLRD